MSEGIGELAAALAAAQGEIKDPGRAKSGQVKGRRDYRYAPLDLLLQTVRPTLSKHGLSVSQPLNVVDGRTGVRTLLLHSSGQFLESWLPLLAEGGGDQDRGSAITYCRRYSLEAILGIAATEDDDATAATEPQRKPERPAEVPREASPSQAVIDELVRQGWPAASVVAQVRDYAAWSGAERDPWTSTHEAQSKLPEWLAGRAADRLAWTAWQTELVTVLGRLANLDQLGEWLATLDPPRRHPQRMIRDDRMKLLAFLRDGGGLDKLRAWKEAA